MVAFNAQNTYNFQVESCGIVTNLHFTPISCATRNFRSFRNLKNGKTKGKI